MQFNPPQRHALAWGVIALVVGVVLWVLGPVLMPFVVAAVLAYALNPLVRGLERVSKRLIPSLVAVLLVEVGFLVLVSWVGLKTREMKVLRVISSRQHRQDRRLHRHPRVRR